MRNAVANVKGLVNFMKGEAVTEKGRDRRSITVSDVRELQQLQNASSKSQRNRNQPPLQRKSSLEIASISYA